MRNVFFNYDIDDLSAVNVVSKSQIFNLPNVHRAFRDPSLWEAAKSNPSAVRAAIDGAVRQAEVAIVLASASTWRSDWVRYGIAARLRRGAAIVVIDIHEESPTSGNTAGPNPLDYMMIARDANVKRTFDLLEWDMQERQFVGYAPIPRIRWSNYSIHFISGDAAPLSKWFTRRDNWQSLNRYFEWALDAAAIQAGWMFDVESCTN